MKISFTLDNKKTRTIVKSLKVLDVLGELGGLLQVFEIVFAFLGMFISERSFKYAIVEDLFLRKNSDAKPK